MTSIQIETHSHDTGETPVSEQVDHTGGASKIHGCAEEKRKSLLATIC